MYVSALETIKQKAPWASCVPRAVFPAEKANFKTA